MAPMDNIWDKIVPAVFGLIGGGVASIIAPWVNWGIEKRRIELQAKRETIAKWRTILAEALKQGTEADPFQKFLERSPDFYSLKEYLSKESLDGLFRRTIVVRRQGSTVDGVVEYITRDISEVEKRWGLKTDS